MFFICRLYFPSVNPFKLKNCVEKWANHPQFRDPSLTLIKDSVRQVRAHKVTSTIRCQSLFWHICVMKTVRKRVQILFRKIEILLIFDDPLTVAFIHDPEHGQWYNFLKGGALLQTLVYRL